MSGGNCPETPRQKMIGMMYLMLTAMLALNVSGDLLNAYLLVDKSILQAKTSIEAKSLLMYNQFGNAYELNKTKVENNWKQALLIKEKADELVQHIYDLKVKFVHAADGPKYTPENYVSIKNQDVAAQVMMVEQLGKRSTELKNKITEYRDLLVNSVDDTALINNINKALSLETQTKGKKLITWESEKFEHIPLAASMALMSQLQSTTRNLESDVVRYLYSKIDEGSFKFNKIDALVIPNSNYIIAGDEYYARIMMAARDTTQPPTISVPGRNVELDESGVGIMRSPTSMTTVGTQSWKGELSIKSPDGSRDISYPIAGEYIVAPPSIVVSPVKMNVFYEGIENPIEVSVPGVPSENVRVEISNASSVKKGGQFLVTPRVQSAGQKAKITVYAKINNRDQKMGDMEFRIKRVPNPVAEVNGISEGKISKALLNAQMGVTAEMKDFDFDMKWTVVSFKVTMVKGGYVTDETSTSSLFTNAQKEMFKGTARGQKVVIEEIRAEGPGGQRRNLNSVLLTVD